MSQWVGFAVSVSCGEPLGCYQGTILQADGTTITLTKAFRNGFPYPKSQVTLNAADIKDLRIIEEASPEPSQKTHSTVAVTKNNKKAQRATVCENLQANSTHSVSHNTSAANKSTPSRGAAPAAASAPAPAPATAPSSAPAPARSKPIDIQGSNKSLKANHHSHSGSYGNAGSTPKCRGVGERARRRNEACFGDAAEPALEDDFDFEGNLALFDKRALWEEMTARPDVVRAADEAARFRHDENVLGAAPRAAEIRVPAAQCGAAVYSCDDGRRVPSASAALRRAVWAGLRRCGVLGSARTLQARAAADVALRLCGGVRRLEARNAHQAPVAVVAAGAHGAGACGVAAARLLAAHGARAHVLLAGGAASSCGALQREVAAAALSGVATHSGAEQLPAPDVVLLALYDPLLDDPQDQYEWVLEWARGCRAALVCVEPPGDGWAGGVAARAALVAGLPPALPPALGRLYLANVAPPLQLFRDLGVHYRPPFGAASVLPLN